MKDVVIAGVGIHPFGRFDVGYREMGDVAAREALADAGVALEDVDLVLVANVGAEMAKGHNIVDRSAASGVPVINVEAACASSGSALFLAAQTDRVRRGRRRALPRRREGAARASSQAPASRSGRSRPVSGSTRSTSRSRPRS